MSDGSLQINVQMYECPKHGKTDQVIKSTVEGYRGTWCMLCMLEKFDELGIQRVTKVVNLKNENEDE